MAKSKIDTEAVIKLVIDGKQAQTSGRELQATIRRLTAEMNDLKEVDNPQEYKRKADELKKVQSAWESVRHEIRGTAKEAKSFKDSIKDLAADAVGSLSIGGAIYAAGAAFKTLVNKNAELSDSYGRVQKTTGLTEEAVDRLNTKFKKMDTRTANAELLGLAEVAGKLGISAEKDVEGFVRAADKIGVALGEDLGGVEESINSLGKLTDIFKLKDTFGIEEALLKVGSAINTLGASGTAAEKNLVDFANRMAGVAPAAGITIDQVLGLGAVMDELGQSMESSSTAIGQFIIGMGADVPKFAKIAGMSIKDFSKLLKEDANGAMIAVLEKSKSAGGGVEALAKNMGLLEVSGAQGVKALSTLSENLDKLREKQEESAKASAENTSILVEFNNMNTTLGANLDKIWNKIGQIWEISAFRSGMTKFTALIVDNRSETGKLTSELDQLNIKNNQLNKDLGPLLITYDALRKKGSLNGDEQLKLKDTIYEISKIIPESVTEWNKYGEALDINRGKIDDFTAAQKKLYDAKHKDTIEDLKAIVQQGIEISDTAEKEANKLRKRISESTSTGGFISWFGLDKKQMWKDDLQSNLDWGNKALSDSYEAALQLKKMGQTLNQPALDMIAGIEGKSADEKRREYEASKKNTVPGLDVALPVAKTTPATGSGSKSKTKSEAQQELERVNAEYSKLLKASKDFGAARLMDNLATNDKELAQEAEKFQKQIDQWKEFKDRTKDDGQKLEAQKKIDQLGIDQKAAVDTLKVKQEKETTKKIEDLRTNLSNKQATELEKERVRINQFYDELEKNAGNDTDEVARIREAKQKELADAVIREEKRIKDETAKLKNETVDLDGDSFDKRLAKVKSAYALELEELEAKFTNELGTREAFLAAKQALDDKYAAQESGINVERETKKAEKEKEKAKERREALLDITQSTADAVFDIMANNRQAETDAILSGIEKQREKELSNKNLTESQKQKINEKYDRQARAEKLRAWKAEKAAALSQSFINTALAVTKALPNVFLAAAAGAAGLLQSVTIAAQKPPIFAKGGIIPNGPSHAQGGLNVVDRRNRLIANIEGGEPILSRDTYANNREVVDALIYSSQRKAGARVNINPMLLDVEQSVRRGGMAMQRPIVNVDNSNAMDMDALAQSVERMVDNKINNIRVNLSYHDLQDSNDKVVSIKNSVDA